MVYLHTIKVYGLLNIVFIFIIEDIGYDIVFLKLLRNIVSWLRGSYIISEKEAYW